jgi:hypothetical protein
MSVGSEQVTQTRLATMDLLYEVQITLMLLEQLPVDPATTPAHLEELNRLLDHRQLQIDARVRELQGRLSGAVNEVRVANSANVNGVEIPG